MKMADRCGSDGPTLQNDAEESFEAADGEEAAEAPAMLHATVLRKARLLCFGIAVWVIVVIALLLVDVLRQASEASP